MMPRTRAALLCPLFVVGGLTGRRMTVPSGLMSNDTWLPADRPKCSLTAFGMVIWPLVVTIAAIAALHNQVLPDKQSYYFADILSNHGPDLRGKSSGTFSSFLLTCDGVFQADARVYSKARFCWRKIRQVKGSFAPLASQADGRVTFVLETKVTKNS